jgi:hypothetical protein
MLNGTNNTELKNEMKQHTILVCIKRTKFSARERFFLNVIAESEEQAIQIVHCDLADDDVYQIFSVEKKLNHPTY